VKVGDLVSRSWDHNNMGVIIEIEQGVLLVQWACGLLCYDCPSEVEAVKKMSLTFSDESDRL